MVAGAVIGFLYFSQFRPTSGTVVCRWGVIYGNTVVSYIISGNSTIVTGTFSPMWTETATMTITGYPLGAVGSTTMVTTEAYPLTETCVYAAP